LFKHVLELLVLGLGIIGIWANEFGFDMHLAAAWLRPAAASCQ